MFGFGLWMVALHGLGPGPTRPKDSSHCSVATFVPEGTRCIAESRGAEAGLSGTAPLTIERATTGG